jgi:hypothetical protein
LNFELWNFLGIWHVDFEFSPVAGKGEPAQVVLINAPPPGFMRRPPAPKLFLLRIDIPPGNGILHLPFDGPRS